MHLESFSAYGFRSLMHVTDIPVSCPTILTGRNDGGKSAVLTALAFLLGEHRLTDEDRTYLQDEAATDGRCGETWVEGHFTLDTTEQAESGLPGQVQIRRIVAAGRHAAWEYYGHRPADGRLCELDGLLKGQLAELVNEFGLTPAGSLKDDLLAAVVAYAGTAAPRIEGWQPLPKKLESRLPKLLAFGGTDESPDDAVRTALSSCYETHLEDEGLQGRVRQIEEEISQRLEKEADSLCRHIQEHCTEFVDVEVKPEVSFRGGFKRASLEVSRAGGEPVDLTRSGRGSTRRIALAVWEWTSDILQDVSPAVESEAVTVPRQLIVVYDEPDTHLDYRHQRTVMDLIRKQCELPHVSAIVATHSMNLIDGVDIADVIHLKLNDVGRTTVERLEGDTHDGIDFHLGQIAAALGLRNSVLLHERCFLAVEGKTEQQSVPLLFRLSQGLSLQAAGVALWACDNNEGALHLARYLVEHQRTVMLMIDADSRNNKLLKDDRLRRAGLDLDTQVSYVGEAQGYSELEELFTDEQWAAAANSLWPRATGAEWTASDFTAHRGSGKFSNSVLHMLREGAGEAGPSGKPAMVYGLSSTLRAPEDVPQQLREVFTHLQHLAH